MLEKRLNENCCGCSVCSLVCPYGCITMKASEKDGFLYPSINKDKCVSCGLCERICPFINSKIKKRELDVVYAARNKSEAQKIKSSSGGVYPLLVEHILNNKGAVFGAVLDEKLNVIHIKVENIFDKRLCGSKYIQSDLKESFKEVKEELKKERDVLFSGTPCQIAGLNNYLGKNYENLYTQDVACHGVISPKIWKKYLDYVEEKEKSKVKNVFFRNKSTGWRKYSVYLELENGKIVSNLANDNLLMKTYFSNLSIRFSCQNCKYKRENTTSDITLADFWGVWDVLPEFYDNKGASLVFINTKKGKELFEKITNQIELYEIEEKKIIKYNMSLYKAAHSIKNNDLFFIESDIINFDKLVKKYTHESIFKRIKYRLKNFIKSKK